MAEKHLTVNILSPENTVFTGNAEAVFFPGLLGNFEVLPNHAPIVSSLGKGVVKVRDGGERTFEIKSGIVRIKDNVVTVCVEI